MTLKSTFALKPHRLSLTLTLAGLSVLAAMLLSSTATALTPPTLTELQSLVAPSGASQMEYSPQFDLLFVRDGGSRVRVLDAGTGTEIDVHESVESFTDFDLTPDGQYLFVADYGGERTGYGTPVNPHWVHRYDLAAQTWQAKLAPKIAYRVEAAAADRVVLLEGDQWISATWNDFGADAGDPVVELSRRGSDYRGDIEYDHRTGRLYHGNSGSSSREINVLTMVDDALISSGGTGTYGTAQNNGGGSSVLSTAGDVFYYGRLQVEAADVRNNLLVFPESIRAANSRIAFGADTYYDAATGDPLGSLGFTGSAHALSPDGNRLWVMAPDNVMHQYAVVPEPTTLVLAAIGLLSLAWCRWYGNRSK